MKIDPVKQNSCLNAVTFLVTAAIVILLCALCPWLSDDWHFLFVWEDFDPLPSVKRVEGLQDILVSMQNYYQKSGGRVVPHFIVYCLMLFDKWLFNILNGLIFAAFCYLSYKAMVLITEKDHPLMFPLASLMNLVLLPAFGDNVVWLSGAVNYLWTSVLLFFCVFWLYTQWEKAGTVKFLLMLPVFILSAATNEITGGMLLAALLLRLLLSERRHIKRGVILALCMLPSICMVILAPGNTVRRMTIEKTESPTIMQFIGMLISYWGYMFANHRLLMYTILIGLFMMLQERASFQKILKHHYFFIVGMAGISALAFLGFFTYRPIILGFVVLLPAMYHGVLVIYQNYKKNQGDFLAFLTPLLQSILYTAALAIFFELSGLYSGNWISVLVIVCLLAVIVFSICLGFRLPKIVASAKLGEKDRALLNKIQNFISGHTKHLVTGVTIILCVLFLAAFIEFLQWNKEYRAYQQEVETHILSNDLESAYNVSRILPDQSNLIPVESCKAPIYYYVEWAAAYYGKDTEEFVQKHAVPARQTGSE